MTGHRTTQRSPVVRHCALCGRRVSPSNRTWSDVRAYCSAHNELEVDAVPTDPLESLPVMADELGGEHSSRSASAGSLTRSGREAGHHLPPSGEDVQATRERGA